MTTLELKQNGPRLVPSTEDVITRDELRAVVKETHRLVPLSEDEQALIDSVVELTPAIVVGSFDNGGIGCPITQAGLWHEYSTPRVCWAIMFDIVMEREHGFRRMLQVID